MIHTKIVKIIMAHGKVKNMDIGKQLGVKDDYQYFKKIYRKNVTFALLVQFLDLLNYEIVFRPKGDNLPEYSYRMTWADYKDLPN